jgi:hypothetical protein
MIHTEITPAEQADRLAIRELFDAFAHCADRRDAEGQKSLFTEDTHFVVYMDGQGSEPTQILDGRAALTPVFDDLNRYQATMHFNGQSTITLDGDRATGESYCIAHHLYTEDGRAQPLRRLDRDPHIASLTCYAARPRNSIVARLRNSIVRPVSPDRQIAMTT